MAKVFVRTRTAPGNETWFIQVQNLGPNSNYNVGGGAGANAVLPGGGEGP